MKIFSYPGPLWRVYSVVGGLLVVASVLIWAFFFFVAHLFRMSPQVLTHLIRSWNRSVLLIYRIKVVVSGVSVLPPELPALMVSNHQSLVDIPVGFNVFKGKVRMVAKAELFKIPFFGWALASAGFIPVRRDENSNRKAASDAILEKLKEGFRIWVAPESTRNPELKLLPFKSGAIGMAIVAQVPILPMVVINAREVLPKGSLMLRPGGTVRVHLMEPIYTTGMKIEDRQVLTESLQGRMQAILDAHVFPVEFSQNRLPKRP